MPGAAALRDKPVGSMRIAREGYPLILGATVLAAATYAVGWIPIGIVLTLLAVAVTAFFRDPERTPPAGEGIVLAPADGKVVSILTGTGGVAFTGAASRISIFLSPLDVHINRAPVAGKIEKIMYSTGKFLAAYREEASSRNEQNALHIVDPGGREFGVVQIAGVLARRIVCRVRIGDILAPGERFGLIMFGSRTDLYLPKECRVEVREGQRVKGGETIVGRIT